MIYQFFSFFFLTITLIVITLLPTNGYGETTPFTTQEKKMVHTILFTFKKEPTKTQIGKIEKYLKVISLERFDNFNNDYFRRLFELKFEGTSAFKEKIKNTLLKQPSIESIEPIHTVNALSIKLTLKHQGWRMILFYPFNGRSLIRQGFERPR